jgi:hypothetical protein
MAMITLEWHGPRPPGDPDEMDLLVVRDIARSLDGIESPSDLITHTVMLGDDYEGPSVSVWGVPGDDDHYHCEYHEVTRWITVEDFKEQLK